MADVTRLPTVGIRVPHELFEGGARRLRDGVAAIAAAGIDRVCVGDHVSFHGGRGFDGLVQATALAALCDLEVQTAVYLLPLRHPVPVARQVNSLAQLAEGRFVFGVGVGGEDPNEVAMCGVDPATRGKRMDESLTIVRALLAGETVDATGGFFELDSARVLPAPDAPVPVMVGGRSAAALRRAGRLSEGYLALWTTPDRFTAAVAEVEEHAAVAGRANVRVASRAPGLVRVRGLARRPPARSWPRRWRGCTRPRSPSSSGTRRTARRPMWPPRSPRSSPPDVVT